MNIDKTTSSNEIILNFLIDWLSWAESENPDEEQYNKGNGLCASLEDFIEAKTITTTSDFGEVEFDASDLLSDLFRKDKLDIIFPFGSTAFILGGCDRTQHLDSKRLAWVKKTIKELMEVKYD